MRVVVLLVVAACTANVPVQRVPIAQRVADACDDLASACAAGNCGPQQAFCGAHADQLYPAFFAENTCKTSCAGVTACVKTCKATRIDNVSGVLGGTTGTCNSLATTCSTTGQGCLGGEFFCPFLAPAPSTCSTQLDTCKAACAPHDRTCLRDCRTAYKQCLAGGTTTVDAGVPDAPAPKPDAPTVTPDAPTVTPDAPTTTTTKYTYTVDIAPKMSGLCNGCHTGSSAPGGYLTDTYSNLFGVGSDTTANIVAGDSTSLWLVKIQGNHHNVLTLYPGFDKVAYDWVVNDAAAK